MPNGIDKQWRRFLGAINGFKDRYGHWPSAVEIDPQYINEFYGFYFTHSTFLRLTQKVTLILEPDARFVAVDARGNRYDYSREGFPDRDPQPSAEEWLGVRLDGEVQHDPWAPQPEPEPGTFDDWFALDDVQTLIINLHWSGYSPLSPAYRYFTLTRQADGSFRGPGKVGVTDNEPRDVRVKIPADASKAFFRQLATTYMEPGQYQPQIDHTDDYPYAQIVLVAYPLDEDPRIATFFSHSQGEFRNPWGVFIQDTLWGARSEQPGQALNDIDRFLKPKVLAKMTKLD